MAQTALHRDVAAPLLEPYIRRVLRANEGKELFPEELARLVTVAMQRDTGTGISVTSSVIGSYLRIHDISNVKRLPRPDAAGYLYTYQPLNDDDDE